MVDGRAEKIEVIDPVTKEMRAVKTNSIFEISCETGLLGSAGEAEALGVCALDLDIFDI